MTEYEQFEADLAEKVERMWDLVDERIDDELTALYLLLSQGPLGWGLIVGKAGFGTFGEYSACDRSGTNKTIEDFKKDYCFDTAILDTAIDDIETARNHLKTSFEGKYDAIDDGLDSWDEEKNTTAYLFQHYYVDPLIERFANQLTALGSLADAISGVAEYVKLNREALKNLIDQMILRLETYCPYANGIISLASIQLTVLGVIPGSGTVLTTISAGGSIAINDYLVPLATNHMVNTADMMGELRTAIGDNADNADTSNSNLKSEIDSIRLAELVVGSSPDDTVESDYIFSRPSVMDDFTRENMTM